MRFIWKQRKYRILKNDTFEKRLTYYYIGQFSRYIKKSAVRIGTTRYTDRIEVTGFLNPDGSRAIVLLNKTDAPAEYTLRENGEGCMGTLAPHSIQTICY
ncbi:glycoside hydrolase family 30 beta sandwich domain-containing protein [Roseburia sp.]|uniref:glycoside hydrolase family 30 beta sandwich domain-containing protein n=1 Tax=Roseburia sp. TaxID=2049040 RepID=UPI0035219CA9